MFGLLFHSKLENFQQYLQALVNLCFHKEEMEHLEDLKKIERLAIIRPFGKNDTKRLHQMFSEWDKYLPCRSDPLKRIHVDIFLSYSQTYDTFELANEKTNQIINEFMLLKASGHPRRWPICIQEVSKIEMNIDPKDDIYRPEESRSNRMWVHGPNEQFVKGLKTIIKSGLYDAAFVMEPDVIPVKDYWLETFVAEAETRDFAILGR